MAMPAVDAGRGRRWTAREVRQLIAESPLQTPRYELVVAIEVLSPSSSRHDRVTKRPLYLRHVSEYWIVDPYARVVERWTPDEERPEILTATLEWHPRGAAEPFRLALPAFFASAFDEKPL